MAGARLQRDRQPRAAIEVAGIAPSFVPVARGVGKVALHPAALRVLLEPAAQARPLTQQRLVRDLDRSCAHREQPSVGEHPQHGLDVLIALAFELGQRDPPANGPAAGALAGEAQQQRPRDALLPRVELAERLFRQPGNGAAHASRAFVGRVAQAPPVAPLPELEQRGGQQRQRSGFVLDVRDQGVRELGLEVQAGALGRLLDRPTVLVGLHRPDEHVVGPEQPRQLRVRGAAPVEVRPHREHDEALVVASARGPDQRVDECRTLGLVTAGGEHLLELVDHQHDVRLGGPVAAGAAQLAHRMLSGSEEHLRPLVAARQDARGQRGQQSRLDDRRFAAPRRPHHSEQRRADGARDELRGEPLAAEEIPRVGDVEGGKALERAHHRRLVRDEPIVALARGLQVDHAAGKPRLGGAQLAAAGRRAGGEGDDKLRRLAARPRARRLVHRAGDAAADAEQLGCGHVAGGAVGGIEQRDPAYRVGVERAERERVLSAQAPGAVEPFRGDHRQHRLGRELARQLGERGERAPARIEVVHDQQRGDARLTRPTYRSHDRLSGARGVQHA